MGSSLCRISGFFEWLSGDASEGKASRPGGGWGALPLGPGSFERWDVPATGPERRAGPHRAFGPGMRGFEMRVRRWRG